MVTLRNQADGLIHAARKAVKDAGDKATDAEKAKVESAAKALEEAMKSDDKDDHREADRGADRSIGCAGAEDVRRCDARARMRRWQR